MKKINLKEIIVEVLVTALITFISQILIYAATADNGKIEVTQANGIDNNNVITIGIKNFEKNKNLENIQIEVLKNINIEDVYVSSKDISYKDNIFNIEKIIPEQTEIVTFKTSDKIEAKDIKIINNKNKITIEKLNEQTSMQIVIIISVILYVIVFSIISVIIEYFSKKRTNIKVEKIRNENKENELEIKKVRNIIQEKEEQIKALMEKSENEFKILKNENYELQLYYFSKIKDLTKELDFYKELLMNHIEDLNDIKCEELNNMVKEQLKTYNTDKKIEESYETIRFLADRLNSINKNN